MQAFNLFKTHQAHLVGRVYAFLSLTPHFLIPLGLSLTTNGAPLMHEGIKKAQRCWSARTSGILASIFSSSFSGSTWLHLQMAAQAWIQVLGRWSTGMVWAPQVHPTAPLMAVFYTTNPSQPLRVASTSSTSLTIRLSCRWWPK